MGGVFQEKVEMTCGFPENDICVNVDNSVDFVDFLAKGLSKNDMRFKLSTKWASKSWKIELV